MNFDHLADPNCPDFIPGFALERLYLRQSIITSSGAPYIRSLAAYLNDCHITGIYDRQYLYNQVRDQSFENGHITGMCVLGNYFLDRESSLFDTECPAWRSRTALDLLLRDFVVYRCNVAKEMVIRGVECGWIKGAHFVEDWVWPIVNFVVPEDQHFMNAIAEIMVDAGQRWRGVELYERGVDIYCIVAMHGLANVLSEGGGGVERNMRRVVELLEMAIQVGRCTLAMEKLAVLYRYGAEGIEADCMKSVKYYEMVINEDHSSANIVNLARVLLLEEKCKNVRRAKHLLEYASSNENLDAYWELACLFRDGNECVERDHREALMFFEKIIEADGNNTLDAKMQIALLLTGNSHLLQQDRQRGIRLYEEILTEESNLTAMFNLAKLLRAGNYDENEYAEEKKRAITLCERAILEHNDTRCTVLLALILAEGEEGLMRNEARVISLLERASEMGHALGRYNLAVRLCDSDLHLPLDIQRGVKLYELAIEKDENPYAMVKLAIILKAGKYGVEPDIRRAMTLFKTAIQVSLNYDRLELVGLGLWNNSLQENEMARENRKLERKAYIWAMHCVAEVLLIHHTHRRNFDLALTYLERALRDPSATNAFSNFQFNVAMLRIVIEAPDSTNRERDRTVRILGDVIGKTGNTIAMRLLGNYALSGRFGVPQDTNSGLSLFARAVFAGAPEAMLQLGKIYCEGGHGVSAHKYKSFDLFTRAVRNGNSSKDVVRTAMVNLAQLRLKRKRVV